MTEREFTAKMDNTPIHLVMSSEQCDASAQETIDILDHNEIGHCERIISATQTPELLDDYAAQLRLRKAGLVIIAYSVMKDHLAADLRARLPIAVIGVDCDPDLSITNRQKGELAALDAMRILAVADPEVRHKVELQQALTKRRLTDIDTELQVKKQQI